MAIFVSYKIRAYKHIELHIVVFVVIVGIDNVVVLSLNP